MSEWKTVVLGDVAENGMYGYTESATLESVGPHFLRITDIQNGIVNWGAVPYCPIKKKDKAKYLLKEDDIVIARTGNSTGENYIFEGNEEAVFASYLIRFRVIKDIAFPKYVWYNMRTTRWKAFINGFKSGSAQEGANANILREFPFLLPELAEQKEIAKTLSNLDQKITLLRQQNQDLEELAQTLFKRWFVEFEFPNENGEPYKSSGGKMVESELGEIPEGWRVGSLKNFISIKHGYAFKGENITNIENNQILVTPGSFKIGGGFNLSKFKYYNSEYYPEEYKFSSNDLVVTMTDLSKNGDSLGFPALIPEVKGKIMLHNQRVGKVIVKENLKYFFYYLMQRREYRAHVVGSSTGTTVRHTSPIRICEFKYIYDEEVMIYFGKVVEPSLIKIINNISEIQTLIQLRDTLLPKLMSGELKVTSEEKNVAVH